jgi:hypothetical protein
LGAEQKTIVPAEKFPYHFLRGLAEKAVISTKMTILQKNTD